MSIHQPLHGIDRLSLVWLKGRKRLAQLVQTVESGEYKNWRQQFLWNRLSLALRLSIPCIFTFAGVATINHWLDPTAQHTKFPIPYPIVLLCYGLMGISIIGCAIFHHSLLGRVRPGVSFLWLSWSATLIWQIVSTLYGVALPDSYGWSLVFLAQATLVPVRWRLHLVSHLGVLLYFALVNWGAGYTTVDQQPVWSLLFLWLWIGWVCFICTLGVYLYERLKRTEFEAQRELQVFLQAATHDLRSPVLGTSMVLQNLLKTAVDGKVTVDAAILEQLLQGSDRQLAMINALLEAHETGIQGIVLDPQPLQLRDLTDSVLCTLTPVLQKNQIHVNQRIAASLPLVHADLTQLRRVFTHLISNAIQHNPHGITLMLDADIVTATKFPVSQLLSKHWLSKQCGLENPHDRRLRASTNPSLTLLQCRVTDNGVGIREPQCERLFERYSRGSCARYMPGLGLGLYLCREIIQAHQGQIGVLSQPGQGTQVWFTLPLSPQNESSGRGRLE